MKHLSARGPVLPFVNVRSCTASARRGKGCPPGAHAVAVGAAHRLHCAARSGVAPLNSLRSLRSLRSNRRGESVDEARAARAPTPALRCSSPPKSRPAGSPCREVHGYCCSRQTPPRWLQRRARAGRSAPRRRREAQGSWPRAQRASRTVSSRLFERRERSERSELSDVAMRPSIAGESQLRCDRRGEALRPARARLCRTYRGIQRGQSKAASGRLRTPKTTAAFHPSRKALSAMDH